MLRKLRSWPPRTQQQVVRARVVALAIMLLLVAAIGRSSAPPRSWASRTAETRGAFLCPAFLGETRIVLSPSTAEAAPESQRRRLTILHEEVHVQQAREYPGCWFFNAAMRLSVDAHLRFEAAAHCAEAQQQLAWLDARLRETPFWRSGRAGRTGYRERWWDRAVAGVSGDLLIQEGHYARIAELGDSTVVQEVRRACGTIHEFPAPDHPLLDSPSVPVGAS